VESPGVDPTESLGESPPREWAEALGRVTLGFCLLEGIVEECLWEILEEPASSICQAITAECQAITAELPFRRRLDLLSSLHRLREPDPARQEMLRNLLSEAQRIEDRRNELVHSLWRFDVEARAMVRTKATAKRRGLRIDRRPVATSELLDLLNWMSDVHAKLHGFFLAESS